MFELENFKKQIHLCTEVEMIKVKMFVRIFPLIGLRKYARGLHTSFHAK